MMPISFNNLPDHVKNLINLEDARRLGLLSLPQAKAAGVPLLSLPSKQISTPTPKRELQAHSEFLAWIQKFNSLHPLSPILALHANPAKPSRINPGWPDFSLFHLLAFPPLFIEFKASTKSSTLSHHQLAVRDSLLKLGHSYFFAFSSSEAINLTSSHFKLNTSQ